MEVEKEEKKKISFKQFGLRAYVLSNSFEMNSRKSDENVPDVPQVIMLLEILFFIFIKTEM